MIILKLKDGDERRFNLKNPDKERSLRAAWYSMRGEKKYENKKIKITTEEEVLLIPINDITECEYDESRLVKGEVGIDINKREKKKAKRENSTDHIMDAMEREKRRKIDKFIFHLKEKGVDPDTNDPMFIRACESVGESVESKIPIFVNIYANSRGGIWR